MSQQQSAVAWIGTLNNWTNYERTHFEAFCEEHCAYWIYQQEVGEHGTPHLQAYICLLRKGRLSYLRARLVHRWHWETRRGSHKQAKEYCSKLETRVQGTEPVEGGEEPHQGKRSDLEEFANDITSGLTNRQLVEKHAGKMLLYSNHANRLRELVRPKPEYVKPRVTVLWGDTDTGKSRFVFEQVKNKDHWKAMPGEGKWFDGYEDHEIAWFDDFRGAVPYELLLNILDGYGTRVNIKCSTAWFKPKEIWITSNARPEEWYDYSSKNPYAALKRRISTCIWYQKVDGVVTKTTEWDDQVNA